MVSAFIYWNLAFCTISLSNPGTEDHGECLYLLESCFLYHFSIKPRGGGPWWVLLSIGILLSVPFLYQTQGWRTMVSAFIYWNLAFCTIYLSKPGVEDHGECFYLLESCFLYHFSIKPRGGGPWWVLLSIGILLSVPFLYQTQGRRTMVSAFIYWNFAFCTTSLSNPGVEDHGECFYLLESCFLYHFSIKPRDGGPWWVLVFIGILLSVPFIYQTQGWWTMVSAFIYSSIGFCVISASFIYQIQGWWTVVSAFIYSNIGFCVISPSCFLSNPGVVDHGKCLNLLSRTLLSVSFLYQTEEWWTMVRTYI